VVTDSTYRNGGRYKRLYHGTSRACHIGESGNDLKLCYDSDCGTCSILRESFKLKYAGEFSVEDMLQKQTNMPR
jgi:hypothetical protein